MKKFVCGFFLIFFVAQGLMFLRPPEEALLYENRKAREFPSSLRFSTKGIKEFFRGVDGAFNDRMLAREQLVAANGFLAQLTGNIGDYNQAFNGRENWLFLGDNFNGSLEKLLGRPSAATSRMSNQYIKSVLAAAEQLKGPEIMVMVAPNKSAVYPEKLPRFMKPAAVRYSNAYVARLREAGLTIVDPLEALKSAKPNQMLYYRSDTHWNMAGAAVAFQALLDQINSLNKYGRIDLPEFSLIPQPPFKGDLVAIGNFKQYQAEDGDNFKLVWTDERPELTMIDQNGPGNLAHGDDLLSAKSGRAITVINPAAVSNLTVWFYHDSFGVSLAPFFHAVFAKTVHVERGDFGKLTPPGDPPDLVVLETVERYI